ncbi:MAG: YbaN family protein [Paracoccaceae bacterium]
MRYIWASLGLISVGFGLIGIVLPLIPTVPFMLLAAFFFARSSERMHNWLLGHRIFGPAILDWQTRGAIHPRGKRLATISIVLVFGISLAIGLRPMLLVIQGVTLSCVLIFLWTRPNG